jgi:hypothetical protein
MSSEVLEQKMDILAPERKDSPFLDLFVIVNPPRDWRVGECPPILLKVNFCSQSNDSNVNFSSGNLLTDTLRSI